MFVANLNKKLNRITEPERRNKSSTGVISVGDIIILYSILVCFGLPSTNI